MRWEAFCTIVWVFVITASAQVLSQDQSDNNIPKADMHGGFFFPEWESSSLSSHVGIFPVSRLAGYRLVEGDQSAQSVSAISGRPFAFHSGPDYCGWLGPCGLPWPGYFRLGRYSAERVREVSAGPTDQNVVHLRGGMNGATVTEILGVPSQKILLDGREIWQYPGYSLLFEAGALKEIR